QVPCSASSIRSITSGWGGVVALKSRYISRMAPPRRSGALAETPGRSRGHHEVERRAGQLSAADDLTAGRDQPHVAAVPARDAPRDRQPDTGPAVGAGRRAVDLVKWLEQARAGVLRNPRTGVRDAELEIAGRGPARPDPDPPTLRRELQGVVEQLLHRPPQAVGVAGPSPTGSGELAEQLNLPLDEGLPEVLD